MKTIIKPKQLVPGQMIGVVAPSSPPRQAVDIAIWLDRVRDLGFRVKVGDHVYDRHGYLAGLDKDRATDINQMFADDEVDAIFCLRSGYGSARTLQYLDFDLIRQHPKVIIGYSDLTALILAIHARTGLVTFHGPECEDQLVLRPYSKIEFEKVLMLGGANIRLGALPDGELVGLSGEHETEIKTYVAGLARGRLIGGNLNTIVRLLGTPYEPDFRGAILFLETYGQDTYALGGFMHHLMLANKLQQVAGVVFGQFPDCEEIGFTKHDVLSEHCAELNIPAVYGMMIGHMEQQTTLPIGCEVELNADLGTLTLTEEAVTG